MPSRRTVVTVLVLAAVLLAGCSGTGGGPVGLSSDGNEQARATGPADGAATAGGAEGTPAAQGAESRAAEVQAARSLVRTARVTLEVESVPEVRSELTAAARDRGGFVAASSTTQHDRGNRTWATARIVLRVPSDTFGGTLETVKESGEVRSAESETTDVTDRLVDLEARLENLRAQRDRLRTLYEEANETEDVLRVGKRLSDVQERIERLEGEKQSLEDRVAYSTITVELSEPEPRPDTPTPSAAYHETSLTGAVAASVDGVVVAARTGAVTVAYALPYLVAFGLPLSVLGAVVYRRERH